MGMSTTGSEPGWAADACTLPAARRPERQEEFGRLFAEFAVSFDRPQPTLLRLGLQPTAEAARRAAELAMAESECCSFFSFTLKVAGGGLVLELATPPGQADVLDRLAGRAAAELQRR